MTTIKIQDIQRVNEAASEFLRYCKNHFFFGFYGELGAGKTTFIKALCRALGSKDNITSPTFSLVNEYSIPDPSGVARVIYHMDFYRLRNMEEALGIGVTDYFKKKDAYCFIEWPEIVESLLPENSVKVKIEKQEDDSRIIEIDLHD